MYSQLPGNLFPSHKLKGNHTSAAHVVTIENDAAEEDQDVKQEGKEETKPLADKEVEALDEV